SLRQLISNGELAQNKPGAAIWVTETETWVVSKTTIEAVRLQLVNAGHAGIPKNVVRIFGILQDHNLIVAQPEGESVWKCDVEYFPTNWNVTLTFLKFKNEILWPTGIPAALMER
ncbi:MAG: TraI domain-containing protein, partial [Crocinitomicaceae bacterium]|nr:TraI domain-containing protein [Crocinitomicaceae bacterium]